MSLRGTQLRLLRTFVKKTAKNFCQLSVKQVLIIFFFEIFLNNNYTLEEMQIQFTNINYLFRNKTIFYM